MVKIVKKDITTITQGIICHGVNCQHAMGSGIALAIKTKWPDIYKSFMNAPKGPQMLGEVDCIDVGDEPEQLFVANCYTQVFYGRDGKKYADLEAIKGSLTTVFMLAEHWDLDVYLPKIGCGLGGLDWESEVLPIIKRIDTTYNQKNTTYICEWN